MSNLLSPIYKCLLYTFCMVAIDDVKNMMYDFYKTNSIPYIDLYDNFVYYSMDTYKDHFAEELENRKFLCGGSNEEKGKW
jgi:hypothetical protein